MLSQVVKKVRMNSQKNSVSKTVMVGWDPKNVTEMLNVV